jgi:hypothetical protein
VHGPRDRRDTPDLWQGRAASPADSPVELHVRGPPAPLGARDLRRPRLPALRQGPHAEPPVGSRDARLSARSGPPPARSCATTPASPARSRARTTCVAATRQTFSCQGLGVGGGVLRGGSRRVRLTVEGCGVSGGW